MSNVHAGILPHHARIAVFVAFALAALAVSLMLGARDTGAVHDCDPGAAVDACIFELDRDAVEGGVFGNDAGDDWKTLFDDATAPFGNSARFTGVQVDTGGTGGQFCGVRLYRG